MAKERKYGGSKRSTEERQSDNKGVKDGTVRKGAGGKTLRRYNAKTGRWQVVQVVDKKGRTEKTKVSKNKPTVPTPDRKEQSDPKPKTAKTYTTGDGVSTPKTPGNKFFDAVGRALDERGGNAAKTRGRDARVKANNSRVAAERRAREKRRQEGLAAAIKMTRGK